MGMLTELLVDDQILCPVRRLGWHGLTFPQLGEGPVISELEQGFDLMIYPILLNPEK